VGRGGGLGGQVEQDKDNDAPREELLQHQFTSPRSLSTSRSVTICAVVGCCDQHSPASISDQ